MLPAELLVSQVHGLVFTY